MILSTLFVKVANYIIDISQSAGAVKDTNCISAER